MNFWTKLRIILGFHNDFSERCLRFNDFSPIFVVSTQKKDLFNSIIGANRIYETQHMVLGIQAEVCGSDCYLFGLHRLCRRKQFHQPHRSETGDFQAEG